MNITAVISPADCRGAETEQERHQAQTEEEEQPEDDKYLLDDFIRLVEGIALRSSWEGEGK